MRLPWEKLTMEVIEVTAPELGENLYPPPPPDLEEALAKVCKHYGTTPEQLGEALAGWGIVKSIKWALARCPDHQPPSANAVVRGSGASRQLARAAGYGLNPEHYVKTAAELAYPTLERVAEGIRFRGLDRYDAAWGESHKAEWKAWKAAHPARYPPEPPKPAPPEPQRTSGGVPAETRRPDPDPDPDAERDPPPPPQRAPPKLVVVGKTPLRVEDLTPEQLAKWERVQLGREHRGLLRETAPPAAFPEWCSDVDRRPLVEAQWVHAQALYLRDEHFADRKWPTAVFITPGVWLQRLPLPPEEAAR